MPTQRLIRLLLVSGWVLLLAACAAPQNLPSGLTPIPTLIPATEPGTSLNETATPSLAILSYPAGLPSAARGQPLYETNCASCHGADGHGTVPGARNFSDLDYMRGESPAYFYGTVSEGRGDMPSFQGKLTSDQIWDVVFYVWRFSTSTEILAQGQQIFTSNCTACHGANGTGAVLGAIDFTDPHLMDDLAPRDLYEIVTQGKGSMPAWQGRLSQDERWAVIDYLRAFTYDPTLSREAATAAPAPTATTEAACDPSQTNPLTWDDAAAIVAGQAIYQEKCAACHGADGSGALPGTPNFTTAEVHSALLASSGEYLCVIADGQGAMPAWKSILTTEQMWQVLTFLASLGK